MQMGPRTCEIEQTDQAKKAEEKEEYATPTADGYLQLKDNLHSSYRIHHLCTICRPYQQMSVQLNSTGCTLLHFV